MLKIGQGFDVHAFCEGSFVTLGGVSIEHTHGLKAHSDGDVLLHAIMDALLGALNLGDIGKLFPDTSSEFEGADSAQLLSHVCELMRDRGYVLVNLDSTLMCERPKIGPHREAMQQRISEVMGVSVDQISVKATTTEKLGFTGRSEGIAAQAVVLLQKAEAYNF